MQRTRAKSIEQENASAGGAPAAEGADASFSAAASRLLRAATRGVAAKWHNDAGDALNDAEAHEVLVEVLGAVENGMPPVAPEDLRSPGVVLRRRILELLRAEVVALVSAGPEPDVDLAGLVDLLRRIEHVRERLEPDWDSYFASKLNGPEGLDLVVEVAHDLRSPLTSILFLSETLRRGQSGDLNEIQKRQLGIIYSAALGLISVASDVMELAQGGDRLMENEASPFSVAEVFASVQDIVQPMAEEKGLALRFQSPAADERLGYPVALSRVLLNLTTNALKFTEEGFVELTAAEHGPDRVEFGVRDTGRGIDPDVLETLFQPFRRSRGRNTYYFSGSGLGLAICRKLVEAMGSELRLETRSDWGTRFFFELSIPPVHRE